MSLARIAPLTFFLAATALYLVAQPPVAATPAESSSPSAPATPTPTIHVTSRLVVLDVVVTGADGKPAIGLKPEDFSITEDGVTQKLAAFTEHGSPEVESPNTALPLNTFTVQPPPKEDQAKTVIVLADATSWSATAEMPQFPSLSAVNTGYVRDDIATFVKKAGSTQPIGIVRLDWQGMHLVQGLTTNRNTLTEAIASKRMQPPLGFVVRFARAGGSPMRQLARYVNSIPGRVNLVWITYGGGSPVGQMQNEFPDLSQLVHNLQGTANVLRLSRVSLSIIPLTQGNVWANMAFKEAADAAGGHAYFTGVAQGLEEISTIGSSYYTISYVPKNGNWNGAFRKIEIKVAGFPQAPPPETMASAWSELLGWTEREKSNVLYRRGYFARFRPALGAPPPSGLPARTASPMTQRIPLTQADGNPSDVAAPPQLSKALAFGTLPPDQIPFTMVTTSSSDVQRLGENEPLPPDNFLTTLFRQDRYRNVRIHFWIDPQNLKFSRTADGLYADDLQCVGIVYRDDGVQANSISFSEHLQISEEALADALNSGINFDKTIAVPVAGNPLPGSFFVRVAVTEQGSGRIGAIEIPAEWIRNSDTSTAQAAQPSFAPDAKR